MTAYLPALAGGALIGLAAVLMMAVTGRIAGISGIFAGLLDADPGLRRENSAFLAGLLLALPLYRLLAGGAPAIALTGNLPLLIVGGLLVGFGTRLGSGCTSGHGVCGLARLSPRSAAATAVFVATGMITVFIAGRME